MIIRNTVEASLLTGHNAAGRRTAIAHDRRDPTVLRFGASLARRGPATAWEIYRPQTSRAWLDHRVSDRFFSREVLAQCCATLFPGCQLDRLGGTILGLAWDSTP
jgi:hypothetical protein